MTCAFRLRIYADLMPGAADGMRQAIDVAGSQAVKRSDAAEFADMDTARECFEHFTKF